MARPNRPSNKKKDFDNTNRVAIFVNDKDGNDKAPDYRGTVNIEGTDYRISLWKHKPKSGGAAMLRGSVDKDEREQFGKKPAPSKRETKDDFDDDIGF